MAQDEALLSLLSLCFSISFSFSLLPRAHPSNRSIWDRILPANKEQVCALQINNNSDEFSCAPCLFLLILPDRTMCEDARMWAYYVRVSRTNACRLTYVLRHFY